MIGPNRRDCLSVLAGATLAGSASGGVAAPSRAETLRYVTGGVVNTLDPVALGATPESTALGSAVYDRLLRFGRRPSADGTFVFEADRLEGELAESHTVSPDGREIVLTLRDGATWHDGAPVTADDVKWSFDRGVGAPTMSKAQVATGSLAAPEQMTVVDPRTVRITLERPDRLALANLATNYLPMYNAVLAKRHATADDPWAMGWLKENTAAGGAYRVEQVALGRQVTLVRNEAWRNGAMPWFPRAIVQTVPEATTRAALIAKGDADLTTALQPEDLARLGEDAVARVVSTPMPTGFGALIFNTRQPPFDRVEVRRALAMAVPYGAILATALGGRAESLSDAGWAGEPPSAEFPQPLPWRTDLAAARAALAAAGLSGGFETTLSYSVSRAAFGDPVAALIQESFAALGVRLLIERLPDPVMAQAVTEKRLPMLLDRSFALFPSTEYFFRVFASGPSRWNLSSWQNAEVDALLSQARFEPDDARYAALARRLIGIMASDVPMAFIWRPTFDVAMARGIAGFTTWYHYYPDLRDLSRA